MIVIVLIGVAGAAAISWGYWIFKVRPRIDAIEGRSRPVKPGRFRTLRSAGSHSEFDLAYKLPGSPQGAAWDGKHLVVGNRKGGAFRVRRDDDELEAQSVSVIEPAYQQNMDLYSITWNGENFVGYANAAWFQRKDGNVFTIHDRDSLRVLDHHPAPAHLGCLAWDGTSYWAATRRNTADSPEPALLYKLDPGFAVVSTTPAPGVGCQGMAWDGRHLWLADVFSDAITVVDVSSDPPEVVHSASTSVGYLSGIVVMDGEIWVTDYGDDRLQRLKRSTQVAWSGGAPAALAVAVPDLPPASDEELEEFRRKLRSDHWADRSRARMELDRRKAPVDFARDEDSSPDREPDGTDALDWQVELRDGAIYGSWKLWFGDALFADIEQESSIVTVPKFARYEFTVELPSGEKVKRGFDATAGEHAQHDVHLADAPIPGEYSIDLFIHVQYVTAEGTGRILNNSEGSLTLRK